MEGGKSKLYCMPLKMKIAVIQSCRNVICITAIFLFLYVGCWREGHNRKLVNAIFEANCRNVTSDITLTPKDIPDKLCA